MALFDSVFFIAYALFSFIFSVYINRYGIQKSLRYGLMLIFIGSVFWVISLDCYSKLLFVLFSTFIIAIGVVILFIVVEYIGLYLNGVRAARELSYFQGAHAFGAFLVPLLVTYVLYNNIINVTSMLSIIKVLFIIVGLISMTLYIATKMVSFPLVHDCCENIQNKIDAPMLFILWMALFTYVGVEITIGSFIIPMGIDGLHLPLREVKFFLSIYWLLIIVGRVIGGYLMRYINEMHMVCCNVIICIISMVFVINTDGILSLCILSFLGLWNSIIFPVLYSAAFSDIPSTNIKISGIMAMAISGGAVIPFMTGLFCDFINPRAGFFSILFCYVFIFIFIVKLFYKSFHSVKECH
jgi:MFS transporter, FHS family, L-fucose permease